MIRVYAGDRQIDLADNPYIESQLNSPFVGQQQNGSVVYPFSAPFTANNDAIFEYFRLPEANIDRTKTHIGRMYDDNILIVEGILSIKKSDTTYSIEISGPPAGVPESFWSKNLRKVDIGSHEFQSKKVTTNVYSLKITPDIQGWFAIARSNLKIYTPNRVFVNYTFPANDNSINPDYQSGSRSFGERILPVAYAFNEDAGLKKDGYELLVSKSGLALFVPENITNTLSIKILIKAVVSAPFGIPGESYVEKEFEFSRVIYDAPVISELHNLNTINSPFVFPTIYNPDFYSEDNKIFSKYINFFDGIIYKENTYKRPTEWTLVPMLSLHFVIKKILNAMDYTPSGAFFVEQSFKNLIIENTKSIDKQCEMLDWVFNVYQLKFNFNEHLPDISIKDFFDEIKNYFGLAIEYNVITRICDFNFIEPVIISNDNEDYSEKVGREISLETSMIKKIQFSYDNSYVLEEDKNHEINLPIPLDSVVESNPEIYTTIKSKISSLPVLNKYPSSESSLIQDQLNLNNGIGLNLTINEDLRIFPYCKQKGNSVLYNQEKTEFGFRLLIFLGKQMGPLNVEIIKSDYKDGYINLSLSETDPTSRYTKYLKAYRDFLENAVEATTDVFLTDAEVASFNWRLKKYIRGIHYLVHQLSPTLPVRKAFKMKMKRIL